MKAPLEYEGIAEIFGTYWRAYGGARALIRSPYLHASLVLLAITCHTWVSRGWWDGVINVMPNVLGFTLGGFAIFIGFGDENFRRLVATLSKDDGAPSAYVELCSTFVHFVVLQALAILFAVVAKSLDFYVPWNYFIRRALNVGEIIVGAIGYGLFIYALISVVAVCMHLFRVAEMYAEWHKARDANTRAGVRDGQGANDGPA